MKSESAFAQLFKEFSYQGKSFAHLRNITFFLGAGFSKAWDKKFPTGNELFTFSEKEWTSATNLRGFLRTHGYDGIDSITPSQFKQIVYQLGMYRKYPEIRPRYIDDGNIAIVEAELRALVTRKFKKIADLYYFENGRIELSGAPSEDQKNIIEFFRLLMQAGDGSSSVAEGIRLNMLTTNYDFIPEAIFDSNYGGDDSFLLYTYRGITPTKVCGEDNPNSVHDNWLVHNLIKINGGFEIYKSDSNFQFDYREQTDDQIATNPPQLMLPSYEQDYTQNYFRSMFPKAIRLLQESTILVIVGYSLPEEDALVRFLIRQFAEDRIDGTAKAVFYIDMAKQKDQKTRLQSVFPSIDEPLSLKSFLFSGSFNDWVKNTVSLIKGKKIKK